MCAINLGQCARGKNHDTLASIMRKNLQQVCDFRTAVKCPSYLMLDCLDVGTWGRFCFCHLH